MGYAPHTSKQAVFEATSHFLGQSSTGPNITYVNRVKKTVNWNTIDKFMCNVLMEGVGGATCYLQIKIGGVIKHTETATASSLKNIEVDCSAIKGIQTLEMNVKTSDALNYGYFDDMVIYTKEA